MQFEKLGKLREVNIRKVWNHEQYDFSAWLSQEENIKELGDILGLSLIDIETEKFVGSYRCDILCKDEFTNKVVLIENQLDPTNHDHLGKIITYGSGLDASVIVWIVESARDEHASAIEWLNKHTDENISFFLIEVHAYQIGNSIPAPQFKIIEQPNDFAKNIKAITKGSDINESMSKRLEFWTLFNDVIDIRHKPFNKRKPSTDHWYSVAIGSSRCLISIELVNRENKIRISLSIPNDKSLYDELYKNKEAIEAQFSYKLIWYRLDNKKASYVSTYIDGLDFDKQSNYEELMNNVIDIVIAFRKTFKEYI
ncbi:MAG: DUF4268 domain-containing protein [Clostridiales bacterium]|nr:DUF4268 domain-containing protein [Clostridiales bacterium]